MRFFFTTIISLYFLVNHAAAQTADIGSWNIINLQYSIDDKLSVFGEAQLRSLKLYNNFHYYEYKGGFNYKVNKNLRLTLGTGSY
jgi:hypothetical protein